ncbi:MAG: hypothetical protein ACYC0U_03140 [Ilumatobacteraceae bacterium]
MTNRGISEVIVVPTDQGGPKMDSDTGQESQLVQAKGTRPQFSPVAQPVVSQYNTMKDFDNARVRPIRAFG